MSLRARVYGFNYDEVCRVFGSGSRAEITRAVTSLGELFGNPFDDEDDPEVLEAARRNAAVIEQAIMHEVPFAGLDAEDDSHVHAAIAIVEGGKELYRPDEGDDAWHITALEMFIREQREALGATGTQLLTYMSQGRPLFGRRPNQEWSYYAYLRLEEIMKLGKCIRDLQKRDPRCAQPAYMDGFLIAILGWLVRIAQRKMDLWMHAM